MHCSTTACSVGSACKGAVCMVISPTSDRCSAFGGSSAASTGGCPVSTSGGCSDGCSVSRAGSGAADCDIGWCCWSCGLSMHLQQLPQVLQATHGGHMRPKAHRPPHPSLKFTGLQMHLQSSCSLPHIGQWCSPSSTPLNRIASFTVMSPLPANWSSVYPNPMHTLRYCTPQL